MLDEPDEELVELIGSRVYEKLNLRPEKSQVIAALRGNPVPMAGELQCCSSRTVPSDQCQRAGHLREGRLRSHSGESVTRYSTHKAIYAEVVDLLYERHAH